MMEETLYDQLSARERKIIRQSLDPDVKFYNRSPQNSPRNNFRTSKELTTQNSLPKVQNDEEKESDSATGMEEKNENDSDIKNDSEKQSDASEAQSQKDEEKSENKTENEEMREEEEENMESEQENIGLSTQINENENSTKIEIDDTDILNRKLSEMSMKHTIQQKILIQQAEINLKKNNYSPGSLRGFIIKSNNLKQKRQEEMMRIYEKYGKTNRVENQYSQKVRSQSVKPVSKQRDFNSSRGLNLTPRLSMFASSNRVLRPNPRFSTPAPVTKEQNGAEHTEHIKLPPVSQSQQIPNQISLFETQSEKVYQSEKIFSSSLNDPFSLILSQQELAPSPSIRLNVKPPPPPPKKVASPRKQSKKKSKSSRLSRSSKMGRARDTSAMSVSQEPTEPPPPPIKRHILTMRASLIPKNGIIDFDKRDFLDFLNDREEEIVVEVKEEPNESESQDKASIKSGRSRSKTKSRNKTKSKASSRK